MNQEPAGSPASSGFEGTWKTIRRLESSLGIGFASLLPMGILAGFVGEWFGPLVFLSVLIFAGGLCGLTLLPCPRCKTLLFGPFHRQLSRATSGRPIWDTAQCENCGLSIPARARMGGRQSNSR